MFHFEVTGQLRCITTQYGVRTKNIQKPHVVSLVIMGILHFGYGFSQQITRDTGGYEFGAIMGRQGLNKWSMKLSSQNLNSVMCVLGSEQQRAKIVVAPSSASIVGLRPFFGVSFGLYCKHPFMISIPIHGDLYWHRNVAVVDIVRLNSAIFCLLKVA